MTSPHLMRQAIDALSLGKRHAEASARNAHFSGGKAAYAADAEKIDATLSHLTEELKRMEGEDATPCKPHYLLACVQCSDGVGLSAPARPLSPHNVDDLMQLVFRYGAARCDVDRSNTAGNQRACNEAIAAIRSHLQTHGVALPDTGENHG